MGPDEVWEDDRGSVLLWGHKCRKLVLKEGELRAPKDPFPTAAPALTHPDPDLFPPRSVLTLTRKVFVLP